LGKEERLALKRRPKVEDVIIGTFVILALLYPLIITVLIKLEEPSQKADERKILRSVYLLLLGLERCEAKRVLEITKYMDRKLLKELGGVEGILQRCRENSGKFAGELSVKEKYEVEGSLKILSVEVEGRLKIKVYGKEEGEGFRIVGVEYAEGS